MECPECGSEMTRIYRTVKAHGRDLRRHRCLRCGCEFGSIALVDYIIKPGSGESDAGMSFSQTKVFETRA